MKINKIVIGLLTLSLLAITSCKTLDEEALGRFTIISSQNVELSRLGQFKKSPNKVETKYLNTKIKVLFFTVKNQKVADDYQLENALESAVSQVPGGVALVDAKLSSVDRTTTFWPFFKKVQTGYVFEGTVLTDPSVASISNESAETFFFVYDEKGAIASVSEQDFNKKLSGVN